jgi:YfiH family protein
MRNEKHLRTNTATIKFVISTKADGPMKKADGTIDIENITIFLKKNHLPETVVCMEQIHGGNVSVVSGNTQTVIPGADGLVTNTKKISLCIVTADCLPILFSDARKGVIGAAHAGSKGLLKKIIQNTVTEFITKFQSDPKDISVSIGPSIESNCYEVGKEMIDSVPQIFPTFPGTYNIKDGKYFLDLRNIALQSLMKEGILEEHIETANNCTKCSTDTYYSYRGGDKTERFVSVISLL